MGNLEEAARAHVVHQATLSTAAILLLITQAAAKAEELGIAVNIAVCDAGGQARGFLSMQGAHVGATAIASDKAWTSAGFGGVATRELAQRLGQIGDVVRAAIIARQRYAPLPGGMPIWIGSDLVGAIGVSGGTPEQDEACACAGYSIIGAALTKA